ncbi:MAG: hypothetical protein U0S12_00180 [Fimbriimonadales bacterium]
MVFAIGTNANPIIEQTSKLKLNKRGFAETDKNLMTSMAGVFARATSSPAPPPSSRRWAQDAEPRAA